MSYITYTDVGKFLNLTIQANGQELLAGVIPAIEGYIESACNRTWNNGEDEIVEKFDGGSTRLFPRSTPVDTVTSLTVDGTELEEDDDFFIYPGYILLGFPATRGRQNVVLTYTADSTLPEAVKHAMVRWAAQIFKESSNAGKVITRLRQGPVDVEFAARDGIPSYVKEVISLYRLPAR